MEVFEATVRDLSAKGLGVIDHPDGRVFFVPGVWPGDRGQFRVEKEKKRYGFARLTSLLEPSRERISTPCPHLGHLPGQCGGCPWMIVDYSSQLKAKQKLIEGVLTRGHLLETPDVLKNIKPSSNAFGWRNRAQFKTDGKKLGFVSPGTKVIVDIDRCLILNSHNQQLLKALRAKLPNDQWLPNAGYKWNYIEIDDDLPEEGITINQRRPFKQANHEQNEFMKAWIRQKLSAHAREVGLIELFAGSGNFTRVISELGFQSIFANEISEDAVQNLAHLKLPGVNIVPGNVYLPQVWEDFPSEAKKAEVLLLDPPREGFGPIHKFLKKFESLKTIYYISCHLHRFATDARTVRNQGWKLCEVQPVDQFPHTPHIEILAMFRKEL